MATALTLVSERWLDQVILAGTAADEAVGDMAEFFTLPPGIGDVAILEMHCEGIVLATPVSTVELAMRAGIFGSDESTFVDLVGVAKIWKIGAAASACYFSPDPLVLWRQSERLHIKGPDLDSGVTGDLFISVKCVRVHPIEEPAAGPIRLVR